MCSFGTSQSQGYRQQSWVTFPADRALSLLKELAACGVQSITFTGGGEPLIHPQAGAILQKATDLGLAWGLVTNGVLLTGKIAEICAAGATFVRVSLDAGTSATHQITHGIAKPQFDTILKHLRALRRAAPALTIGASFCVQPANAAEVLEAATVVKLAGANYLEVRPTFPTDWRGDGWSAALSADQLDTALTQLAEARTTLTDTAFQVIGMVDRFDALAAPVKPYSACRIGPLTTVIGADGRCWYCCVQRGQDGFSYGNVLHQSFREVWQGHPAVQAGINLAKCPRCRYDGLNTVLEQAFVKDGLHAQFI
jgi:MoaA/NifB/PqqE/SkfB family radical SAM enzyme